MAMQALVMGFGGTGAHILTALKELTVLKLGKVPETIKFLLFDTIADWRPGMAVQIVGGAAEETAKSDDEAASLDPINEYFQLVDFKPDLKTHIFEYLSEAGNPDEYPHLKDWLHAPLLSKIPLSQLAVNIGAAQQRQIGRYAMFKNANTIVGHLSPVISKLSQEAAGADVNVWIIGSSAGGTGAGCFIDAAYLSRLAARSAGVDKLKLTGVIVLPNVYSGVEGISQGRAYSLLRELERVQELGMTIEDRYVDMIVTNITTSSRVVYDKSGQTRAVVENRLFDDLFYLGKECPTPERRKEFFTSVASGIDPYLDANSGPTLLEKAVNKAAASSAFGSARIYVPIETLAAMFAWEQVENYVRRAGAPEESGDRVVGLHSGEDVDRQTNATAKVRGLLKIFEQLHEQGQPTKTQQSREAFVRKELDAGKIVTLWYELAMGNRTPQEQMALLTYANPFYSLIEAEPPDAKSKTWEIKSYEENKKAGGVKEKQEESKERFAINLEEVRKRYINPAGGERTFEKGRQYVLQTISQRLEKKVDDLFIEELKRNRAQFAQSESENEVERTQGTALTRLFAEVTWMLSEQGPLRIIQSVVGEFVATVAREESSYDNRYAAAMKDLAESKRSGFSLGTWVEPSQQRARVESSKYISWYQKHELLKDMQTMVSNVEKRLKQWEGLLGRLFDNLVRRERGKLGEPEPSVLFSVTQIHLKGTLRQRLYRAALNRTALISLDDQPDPQMHGYQDELRKRATAGKSATNLAADLLRDSRWEAVTSADSPLDVALVIEAEGFGNKRYTARDVRKLSDDLYNHFYRQISTRLHDHVVFDYLRWVQQQNGIGPERVAQLLNNASSPLIDAGDVTESRILVYRQPSDPDLQNLAGAIGNEFQALESEREYSDANTIALIRVKKPRLDQINDIRICRDDYFRLLNGQNASVDELRRAQIFHPFRQELEAWHIERYHIDKGQNTEVTTLPPRIGRLLEDPGMMQLFVQGVATGAIENIELKGWVWHGPNEDVMLTSYEEKDFDVIRAAVVFALRQGAGRRGSKIRITRDDARSSVVRKAQEKGKAPHKLLESWVQNKLDGFLRDNAPPDLKEPLKMVFTFYCDPSTRTSLQQRVIEL